MVNNGETIQQSAPGRLEQVRELLNSWLIPNDTREPTDSFEEYASRHQIARSERGSLLRLRDDLRRVVESHPRDCRPINVWSNKTGLRPFVDEGRVRFVASEDAAALITGTVMEAITLGQFDRLKACPDCRWVFYDHTRNRSKRWCLMNAGGPNGRACGTIAKVRRFRERQAGEPSDHLDDLVVDTTRRQRSSP